MRIYFTVFAAALCLSACEAALSTLDDGLDNARDARLQQNETTKKSKGVRVLNTAEEIAVFKEEYGIAEEQTVVQADADNMVVVDEVVTELDISDDTVVDTPMSTQADAACDPNSVLPYAGQTIDQLPQNIFANAVYLLPNASPSDVEAGKLNVFLDEEGRVAFAKCG